MNFVFSAQNPKQATRPYSRKACVHCRRRKQRCIRTEQSSDICAYCASRRLRCSTEIGAALRASSEELSPNEDTRPRRPHFNPAGNRVESPQGNEQNEGGIHSKPKQTSRFIGHLNPETYLLARTRPNTPSNDQENDHLGTWFRGEPTTVRGHVVSAASRSLQRTVNIVRNSELPDDNLCAIMIDVYFSSVHRFVPLVDEADFRRDRAAGNLPLCLLLAVLLAACRDDRLRAQLRLGRHDNHTWSREPRDFAQKIYTHLSSLLKAEANADKVVLIQVHALMSLHCEGPTGNESASLHLITAIHYSQVLGMHLSRAEETDRSGRSSTIFWSLWSLDRLNAAYNGRPTIIHERDMAYKARFTCSNEDERKTFTPFLLWLKLTELLDATIAYYRPTGDPDSTGWEVGFPSFDEIVSTSDYKDVPVNVMYVLEIYYCAIAILTSRFRQWNPATSSNASTIRQALSTLRVLQIADDVDLKQIPALPVIPYAVTLSLSVIYRQCRELLFLPALDRADKQLLTATRVLEGLSGQWWAAEAMAKLGRKAIEKISAKRAKGAGEAATQSLSSALIQPQTSGDAQTTALQTLKWPPAVSSPNFTTVAHHSAPAQSHEQLSPEVSGRSSMFPTEVPTSMSDQDDLYLLDSIPNLLYPEMGMSNGVFDGVTLFGGYDVGFD